MKQFSCGEVVPGCTATFHAETSEEILSAVAEHAQREHGMTHVPPAVLGQVQAHIHEVPAS
jgi:predicted small metal-binding protein